MEVRLDILCEKSARQIIHIKCVFFFLFFFFLFFFLRKIKQKYCNWQINYLLPIHF